MDKNFKLPFTEESLFVITGLLAKKEGILTEDSTWIQYIYGRVSQLEEDLQKAVDHGLQLLREEEK